MTIMISQYCHPPNWPPPPPGWTPPTGWQPPEEWPSPPPGWQFWTITPADQVSNGVENVAGLRPEAGQSAHEPRRPSGELALAVGGIATLPLLYFVLLAVGLADGLAQLLVSCSAVAVIVRINVILKRRRTVQDDIHDALTHKSSVRVALAVTRIALSIMVAESIVGGIIGGVFAAEGVPDQTHLVRATLVMIFSAILVWPIALYGGCDFKSKGLLWVLLAVILSRVLRFPIAFEFQDLGLSALEMALELVMDAAILAIPATAGYLVGRRRRAQLLAVRAFKRLPEAERDALLTSIAA